MPISILDILTSIIQAPIITVKIMRKKLMPLLLMTFLAGGLLTGCNKEIANQVGHDGGEEPLVKMELRCQVAPLSQVETKAESADDKVYRLDILEYTYTYTLLEHHTFQDAEGIDMDSFVFEQWYPAGNECYYCLLANLDEDTVNFIKSKNTDYWRSSSNAVPLSAGNYSEGHIPMSGWAYCGFNGTSPTVQLRRYMFRIDIGNVTADFGEELMAKTVRVKSVSIINACQLFLLANVAYSTSYGFRTDPMGYVTTISSGNPFGGITQGYTYINEISRSFTESSEWDCSQKGGEGALAASFPVLYNYNAYKEKHVLNITATGVLRDISYYSVPSGSGSLAPGGTHVYNVGRSLYGVPCVMLSGYSLLGNYSIQSLDMKLVIEVEVDGVSYFYPILLNYMQPNALYTIRNITLKGPGSEYSNFYERQYYGNLNAPTVLEWTDSTIDNIDVGYKDYEGTEIY